MEQEESFPYTITTTLKLKIVRDNGEPISSEDAARVAISITNNLATYCEDVICCNDPPIEPSDELKISTVVQMDAVETMTCDYDIKETEYVKVTRGNHEIHSDS